MLWMLVESLSPNISIGGNMIYINNYKIFAVMLLICTISSEVKAERKSLSGDLRPQVLEVLQANEKLHGAFFSYKRSFCRDRSQKS